MKLMNIYKELIKEETEKVKEKPVSDTIDKDIEVKEPKEKKLGEPITNEWRKMIDKGLSSYGCKFLFSIANKLKDKSRKGSREEVRYQETRLKYLTSLPSFEKCGEERTQVVKPKEKKPSVQQKPEPTQQKPTLTTTQTQEPELTTTQTQEPTEVSVETTYDNPKVVPFPLYGSESEITDIENLQTDEFIDDLVINLDSQIINQKPEVQEKLKEYNLDAEKMSKLIPLTKETRDFMMKLDMEGLKLPHLMVLYDNIPEFYEAIRNNLEVDVSKLSPVTKVMNYNEFWEWTRKLWDKTSDYLITKVSGTIPELGEEFTVLP
tara:strand:- start:1322 stop:2281 length:960 start_codon:yes stop_codon:yes gene_type:complete